MSGDSAGQPWAGRAFESNSWTGDDGSAPADYLEAVNALHAGTGSAATVVDALRDARLLMPLVASLGEADGSAHSPGGPAVSWDARRAEFRQRGHSAELALPTVAGPDGRVVLPAFSSMAAMQRWNADARPIPAPARQVALGAAADGTEIVIIDAGDERPFVLRRPAIEALARDVPWTPSWQDTAVAAAVRLATSPEPAVVEVAVQAGDPTCVLAGAELRVILVLRTGVGRSVLSALLGRIQERWEFDAVIASRVDSLSVSVRSAE